MYYTLVNLGCVETSKILWLSIPTNVFFNKLMSGLQVHTYIYMYAIAYIYTCILTFPLCILYVDNKIVFVKTPTKRLTLRAKPTDTVCDIKGKIEYETGISVYYQQLKLEGHPLPLLDSYILPSNAQLTLNLETKLSG